MKTKAPAKEGQASGLSRCNGAALRKAARRVSQLYDDVLAPCGLRLSQHSALVHIERAGAPTMSELAKDMVLDRSALSHNLGPLERDGFVEVTVDETDRRSRRIVLTAAGRKKLIESKALWAQAQQRFEGAYGAGKAERLRELLADICSDELHDAFFGERAAG